MQRKVALENKVERERRARKEAEALLEKKSLELFEANQQLKRTNESLEERVNERTSELAAVNDELRLLAMVAARTDNAVIITDATGRIEWVNNGFEVITGYTLDEIRGRKPGSFLQGPDTDQATVSLMRERLANEEGVQCELLNYTKHGRPYWLSIEIQPIRNDAGELTHFMAVESDISERKCSDDLVQMQATILKKVVTGRPAERIAEELCDIVENVLPLSQSAIAIRSGQHSFLRCGPQLSDDEVTKLIELHDQSLPLPVRSQTRCILSGFEEFDWGEIKLPSVNVIWSHDVMLGRDKIGVLFVLRALPRPPDNYQDTVMTAAAALAGLAFQWQRNQHSLERARQRAESASDAKSEFLANMSHEIRTPITAITGYADLLSEGNRPPRDVKWANQIVKSAGHLRTLLDDILDLSTVEAGKLSISNGRVRVRELVLEVVDLYKAEANEKLLDLSFSIAPEVSAFVSDETRLRQMLTNLLSNALKFTVSGSVTISVFLTGAAECNEVVFSVQDTGIGIEPAELEQVFEPFKRLKNGVVAASGTGLGLTITQNLAELMQGRVEVRSQVGSGSEFSIFLPWVPAEETLERIRADNESEKVELAERTVLLVEDNPDNKQIFLHMLEPAGLKIVVANNGKQGLDIALARHQTGNPFEIILMDIQMPVMDGYTATRELRRQGVSAPIIALSAYTMSRDKRKCLEAGCTEFVAKPIVRSQLLQAIRRVVFNQQSTGESALRARIGHGTQPAFVGSMDNYQHAADLSTNPQFAPLVQRYRISLRKYLGSIEAAQQNDDIQSLKFVTHRLVGTAVNYGFPAVSETAQVCNLAMHAAPYVPPEIEDLKHAIRQAIDNAESLSTG